MATNKHETFIETRETRETFTESRETTDFYRKLEDNLRKIEMIHVDSKQSKNFQKNIDYYRSIDLINESREMLQLLSRLADNITVEKATPNYEKLDEYISLLSVPGLNFVEITDLIKELVVVDNTLPKVANITDDIQNDVVFGN